MLSLATAILISGQDEFKPGLLGEYYDVGDQLDDFPALAADKKPKGRKIDRALDFEAKGGEFNSSGLEVHFFVRWTGVLRVAKEGKYTIFAESDDGSRVSINGKQVVDNGGLHPMEEKSGEVELSAGNHDLKVEFFQNEGEAGIKLSWQGPDLAKQIVPTAALWHKKEPDLDVERPAGGDLKAGLIGEYFDMGQAVEDFPEIPADKKAAVRRVDPKIDWDAVGENFAGTKLAEEFYVRWTGILWVPKDGKYEILTESDDGSRVSIDGKQVVDNGGLHAMEEKGGEADLTTGDHEIKVELFQHMGEVGIKLRWKRPGLGKEIVPPGFLFHKPDPNLDR